MEEANNEKVLFKVYSYENDPETSMVEVNIDGVKEAIAVATAIVQVMQSNHEIKKFIKLAEAFELEETLSKAAIHIPDFNDLLGGDADSEGE